MYCTSMNPLLSPLSGTRNGGSPLDRFGVEQPVQPPIADRRERHERQRQRVQRDRDGHPVEVAAAADVAVVGQHDRVVGDGVRLDREDAGRRARRCRARRRAPEACSAANMRPARGAASRGATRGSASRRAAGGGSRPTPSARGAGAARAVARRTRRRCRAPPRSSSRRRRRRCGATASARASAMIPTASMPCVPLTSASPSFAPSSSGSRPARASAPAAGSAPSPVRTRPRPSSGSARHASGARSPDAPSDPCSGTAGIRSRFSISTIRSTTSTRTPEYPSASTWARSSEHRAGLDARQVGAHGGRVRRDDPALQRRPPVTGRSACRRGRRSRS